MKNADHKQEIKVINSKVIDDERIINTSSMLSTPGPILKKLAALFFGAIRFNENEINKIKESYKSEIPVFILPSHSLLDYLYFNYAFLRFALPLVFFANGVNMLLFKPLKEIFSYIWRRIFGTLKKKMPEMELLKIGLQAGKSCLLFLKKPKSLIQWGEDYKIQYLQELIQIQEELHRPITLIPLILVWEQEPEQYKKNFINLVFGDPQAPGRIRKFIGFVLNFRRAYVVVGKNIKMNEFLSSGENINIKETGKIDALAQKLRWTMHHEFQLVEKAIRGPVLKGAKRICEELLKDQAIQREIESIAEKENLDPKFLNKRSKKILKKMAADFHINYIETSCLLLTPIFHKLYAGIDVQEEAFLRIREAARDAPIVFVPSHKSHIDYLIISYILYTRGLIPPHIAAGENLSFWPMGHFFRHCGAFFIKRSVGHDSLYRLLLKSYIKKLLKEGYWIEFFIEGGRSRTGKVLSPRHGMLSMIVDSFMSQAVMDIKFVPVSVTYEKVIEEKSYTKELSGADKKKESLVDLIKAPKVFRTKYGKVFIEFGQILSLKEIFNEYRFLINNLQSKDLPPVLIRRLGHTIMYRINESSIVTTSSLVSMALLTYPKRGISFTTLLSRIGLLIHLISHNGGRFSSLIISNLLKAGLIGSNDSLLRVSEKILFFGGEKDLSPVEVIGDALKDLIGESLRLLYKAKVIAVKDFDEEFIISAVEENRMNLDIYKNNIIHFFINEALLSSACLHLSSFTEFTVSELREETRNLSRMFKYEFIYRAFESYDSIFKSTFEFFMEEHIFSLGDKEKLFLTDGSREVLSFFSSIIFNFIESYWILTKSLISEDKKIILEKDIIRNAQHLGEKLYLTGDVFLKESVSSVNFKNCLNFLVDQEIIKYQSTDKQKYYEIKTVLNKEKEQTILKEIHEHLDSFHKTLKPTI